MTKYTSIVMYESWLEKARKYLADEDVNKLMVQIMEYGFSGVVPKNENRDMNIIFDMVQPLIDANIRNKENGKKGGRPKKEKPGVIKTETTGLSNANANGNANDNANGNADANTRPSASVPSDGDAASNANTDEEWWNK